MLDLLRNIDHAVFHFINSAAAADWLDPVMILISTKWIWIPAYLFLLWLLIRRYRSRVWIVLLLLAVVVALSDSVSSKVIKPAMHRYRPNKAPNMEVRLPDPKDGNSNFGFVSSHAANAFAIFVFAGLFLWTGWKNFLPYLIVPMVVCYSRVYLGVHYPGDVVGGAVVGSILAWLACVFYRNVFSRGPREQGA